MTTVVAVVVAFASGAFGTPFQAFTLYLLTFVLGGVVIVFFVVALLNILGWLCRVADHIKNRRQRNP